MSNRLPINIKVSPALQALFFDTDSYLNDLDIIIVLESDNLSFREFGAFLIVIDRFYGRFNKNGFTSYALSKDKHLIIKQVKSGSLEITIENLLEKLNPNNAIIFYLLIKFLPAVIKAGAEVLINLSEAYYNRKNAQLTRYIHKSLKSEIEEDEILKLLNSKEVKKLIDILGKRYLKEKKYLSASSNFARKKMKSVSFRLKNKNTDVR